MMRRTRYFIYKSGLLSDLFAFMKTSGAPPSSTGGLGFIHSAYNNVQSIHAGSKRLINSTPELEKQISMIKKLRQLCLLAFMLLLQLVLTSGVSHAQSVVSGGLPVSIVSSDRLNTTQFIKKKLFNRATGANSDFTVKIEIFSETSHSNYTNSNEDRRAILSFLNQALDLESHNILAETLKEHFKAYLKQSQPKLFYIKNSSCNCFPRGVLTKQITVAAGDGFYINRKFGRSADYEDIAELVTNGSGAIFNHDMSGRSQKLKQSYQAVAMYAPRVRDPNRFFITRATGFEKTSIFSRIDGIFAANISGNLQPFFQLENFAYAMHAPDKEVMASLEMAAGFDQSRETGFTRIAYNDGFYSDRKSDLFDRSMPSYTTNINDGYFQSLENDKEGFQDGHIQIGLRELYDSILKRKKILQE